MADVMFNKRQHRTMKYFKISTNLLRRALEDVNQFDADRMRAILGVSMAYYATGDRKTGRVVIDWHTFALSVGDVREGAAERWRGRVFAMGLEFEENTAQTATQLWRAVEDMRADAPWEYDGETQRGASTYYVNSAYFRGTRTALVPVRICKLLHTRAEYAAALFYFFHGGGTFTSDQILRETRPSVSGMCDYWGTPTRADNQKQLREICKALDRLAAVEIIQGYKHEKRTITIY